MAVAIGDQTARFWRLDNGKQVLALAGASSVQFSPVSRLVSIASGNVIELCSLDWH